MKKIISLALSLSMLACMATNAFAVETVEKPGYVGGETGSTNWPDFQNPNYEVAIKVTTGGIKNKYRVDVTYEVPTLSIDASDLTWNVQTLEYDYSGASTDLKDTAFAVTVENRSDLPVWVTATINDPYTSQTTNDYIGIKTTKTDNEDQVDFTVSDKKINSAAPGGAGAGTEAGVRSLTFNLYVYADGKEWDEIADDYATKLSAENDTITVGTCTIAITNTEPTT